MRDDSIRFDQHWRNAVGRDQVVNLPCKKCIGCNTAMARDWSVRCFHEAQLHTQQWLDVETKITTRIPNSSVITLTYDEEHLMGLELRHDDFQRFMKRLRVKRASAKPVRYFMAGEYGGLTNRPHFHAVIFGETFDDRYEEISRDGQINQMSYELDRLWRQPVARGAPPTKIGRATVDDFTFAGAAYVAGYVAKKTTAQGLVGPIVEHVDAQGVCTYKVDVPEYRKMSTHPGLGTEWLLRPGNLLRVYEEDQIRISVWKFHPPRYYDTLLRRHRPDLVDQVKLKRRAGMSKGAADWSPERCAAAEQIALDSLQQRRDSL